MQQLVAVVFDFDGTLVSSAALKREGYRAALAAVGVEANAEAWLAYDQHRFLNRRLLLARCYADLTGSTPGPEEAQLLVSGYTDHVVAHPERVQVFPGIDQFAERSAGTPLFISSNAPMDEIGETCERLGFRTHFAGVFGHPISKADAISTIAHDLSAAVRSVLFVGDHPGDQAVAHAVGSAFVHLDPPGEFLDEVPGPSLRSLQELADLLYGAEGEPRK